MSPPSFNRSVFKGEVIPWFEEAAKEFREKRDCGMALKDLMLWVRNRWTEFENKYMSWMEKENQIQPRTSDEWYEKYHNRFYNIYHNDRQKLRRQENNYGSSRKMKGVGIPHYTTKKSISGALAAVQADNYISLGGDPLSTAQGRNAFEDNEEDDVFSEGLDGESEVDQLSKSYSPTPPPIRASNLSSGTPGRRIGPEAFDLIPKALIPPISTEKVSSNIIQNADEVDLMEESPPLSNPSTAPLSASTLVSPSAVSSTLMKETSPRTFRSILDVQLGTMTSAISENNYSFDPNRKIACDNNKYKLTGADFSRGNQTLQFLKRVDILLQNEALKWDDSVTNGEFFVTYGYRKPDGSISSDSLNVSPNGNGHLFEQYVGRDYCAEQILKPFVAFCHAKRGYDDMDTETDTQQETFNGMEADNVHGISSQSNINNFFNESVVHPTGDATSQKKVVHSSDPSYPQDDSSRKSITPVSSRIMGNTDSLDDGQGRARVHSSSRHRLIIPRSSRKRKSTLSHKLRLVLKEHERSLKRARC